jgi:O-antigen/teichoic acid export membrane protein
MDTEAGMDLRQKVAEGVFWSAIANWGGQFVSFCIFLVLSRLLEPEVFGLVALAYVFLALMEIVLDQGFSHAIVQRANLEFEHLDTALWTSVLIGGVLTVGAIAASGLIGTFFQEPRLSPVIRWLSLSFLFASMSSVQEAILQRKLAFKSLAIRRLCATTIGGIVGVTMAISGFAIWSLVTQRLATDLVGAVVLWRLSGWRPGFRFSGRHFLDLFTFGISMVGSKFVDFLNRRADVFLIGFHLGATAVGYYTIAYRLLPVMLSLLTAVITTVAFPTLSRLQHEPARTRRIFYAATQLTGLIAFPAFLGISILAPELVTVLFGPTWAPSIPVMQILAFIGILHSVQYFNGSVLMAAGKPAWRLAFMALTAISNVTAFVLVVRWGIEAVAAAYVVVGYLFFPLSLLMVRRVIQIDLRLYFRQYVAPLISSLAMGAVVLGMRFFLSHKLQPHLALSAYIVAGILTYLLVIQLTAPSLSQQILELGRLMLPELKLRKA